MKRILTFTLLFLLLAALLAGCGDRTVVPEKGDFSFDIPEGYSLGNVTDTGCDILQNDTGAVIGGISVTDLKIKDLTDKNSKNVLNYLRSEFHKTNNVEFFSMLFGTVHHAVSINMTAHYEDAPATDYSHYFFERNLGVYHMWFDMGIAEQGIQLDFRPLIHANG